MPHQEVAVYYPPLYLSFCIPPSMVVYPHQWLYTSYTISGPHVVNGQGGRVEKAWSGSSPEMQPGVRGSVRLQGEWLSGDSGGYDTKQESGQPVCNTGYCPHRSAVCKKIGARSSMGHYVAALIWQG